MTVYQKVVLSVQAQVGSSLGDLFFYVFGATGLWLFFYVMFRAQLQHRRLASKDPTSGQISREVLHSLRSIFIFGIVSALVVYAAFSGWTQLYLEIDDYGWFWFVASLMIMIVLHDTYFYWTHRLMHHRWLYRFFHRTHHLSLNPTPWAAYAFSPAEAFIQAGIGPLIVLILPVHPIAFAIFMVWQISFNVFGHCGYEIYPRWFIRSPAAYFLNSVTHHAQHHEKFQANFGLYFNVWDRLMGTNHAEYESRFLSVTGVPHHRPPSS